MVHDKFKKCGLRLGNVACFDMKKDFYTLKGYGRIKCATNMPINTKDPTSEKSSDYAS